MLVIQRAKLVTLFSYIGRPLVLLFALDSAIAVAYVFAGWTWLALPDVPLSIFGGVIGLIAGFRNTSAYARWWEARTIWGAVVNNSRSFAREVLTMLATSDAHDPAARDIDEIKRNLITLQIGFVHALRNHLRGIPPWNELSGLIAEAEIEHLRTL